MHLSRQRMFASLVSLAAAALIVANVSSLQARPAFRAAGGSAERAEVRRIHAHFDSVLRELNVSDVSSLTVSQQAERAALIGTLRGYNARGVFPHNYDFPEAPTPYFVDRKTGTLCAVAFLLESTGRRDIVNRVARANNNVWVAELAGDSAMGAWLDAHGLTLAEAARIQVPYAAPETRAEKVRNYSFMVVTPVALLGTLVTVPWNALGNGDGRHRTLSYTGIVSGALTAGAAAVLLYKQDEMGTPTRVSVGGMALGAVGMAAGARALSRHSSHKRAERQALEIEHQRSAQASVTPIVPVGRNAGAGLAVSVRF